MATNPYDLTDLLAKQTQFQAAKSGSGGLLDMVLAGYQMAFPRAPVANALYGARQAYNIGQYNKAIQQEALRQQIYQGELDANNAEIYNRRAGTNIKGPFSHDLANAAAGDIRTDNAQPVVKGLLDTGRIDTSLIQPGMNVDPKLIEMAVTRAAAANDAGQTKAELGQWMGGGVPGAPAQPSGQPALQPDPALGLGALQGGVYQNQGVTPAEAFSVGIPDVGQLLTGRNNEQDNARGLQQIQETGRHNKASEQAAMMNAQANQMRAQKYQPGGGGGPGFQEQIFARLSPEQQQQYLARFAGGTTPANGQDVGMKQLVQQAQQAKQIFGENSKEFKAAQQAVRNADIRPYLQAPPSGSMTTPFRNASQKKLQNAGQDLREKYKVVY